MTAKYLKTLIIIKAEQVKFGSGIIRRAKNNGLDSNIISIISEMNECLWTNQTLLFFCQI